MFNIFPYVFSGTFNLISDGLNMIDNIIDNVINSEFMDNLVDNIENMSAINVNFKEHKRAYTIECYLPGVNKENMFYTNNKNVAMAVIQPGGDIEEDYYVENIDSNNIKASFKDNMLRVLIPKNTYISKDTAIVEVNDYID